MTEPEISIIVANWNGAAYLREGLGSLLASGRACGRPFELIVVDDASEDGSVELIGREFPEVRLLINEVNQRFARTCNRGAREARGRIAVMVNNDLAVPPEFIERLTAPFYEGPQRPPVFAVGAKTVEWDDTATPNHLCMFPAWRRGGIGKDWCDPPERHDRTYVQGGAAAYDRSRFLQLGGFDHLFSPGYWEDYDLSYRAIKAGWRSIYEPAAVARHRGKSSMRKILGADPLEQLIERNRLWFVWLNLDAPVLWLRHLAALPWIYGRDLVQGRGMNGLKGFIKAAAGIGKALRERRRRAAGGPLKALSDREILFGKTKGARGN
ncbi:glycosyltransferase family 2 protein [bacterium]|nr:glycosyltransferase family 2 protein [bacterium]